MDKFILGGMGGSHLAAGLLKLVNHKLDLLIHRDYGLPRVPDYFLREALLIASSYSGETEETLDFFQSARAAGLKLAAITTGGRLLELAQAAGVPVEILPREEGMQPRWAMAHFLLALGRLTGVAVPESVRSPRPLGPEAPGQRGKVASWPTTAASFLIYASAVNWPLAHYWQIELNETAKIPAFWNVFPELNHNELAGFTKPQNNLAVVILRDPADHPRILKRMELTAEICRRQGVTVEIVELAGQDPWSKIFNTLALARAVATALAEHGGADPLTNPLVEEFKRRLAD